MFDWDSNLSFLRRACNHLFCRACTEQQFSKKMSCPLCDVSVSCSLLHSSKHNLYQDVLVHWLRITSNMFHKDDSRVSHYAGECGRGFSYHGSISGLGFGYCCSLIRVRYLTNNNQFCTVWSYQVTFADSPLSTERKHYGSSEKH